MNVLDNQIAVEQPGDGQTVPAAVRTATDRAKAEARKVSEERRAHRRVPGGALAWINVARVNDGPPVNIVDLSRSGVLLESDQPLKPGSRQALEIAGPKKSIVVPFGVLRSRVSALKPSGTTYRAACEFNRPLELPELAAAAIPTENIESVKEVEPVPTPVEAKPLPPETLMETVLRESAAPPTPTQFAGYQKVVALFCDGTILKGYNRDFDVNRPSFTLRNSSTNENEGVSVALTGVKAVFFVRDFDGKSEYRERKTFVGQTPGRPVHLTFTDGEMIIGTTQGYRAGSTGFFVTLADPRANDVRIFVISSAVRQVRLP